MKIFKYKPHQLGENQIDMPSGARIISANLDRGDFLCVWAEVNPLNEAAVQSVYVLYTGDTVPNGYKFLATVVGSLVYHIYIKPTP